MGDILQQLISIRKDAVKIANELLTIEEIKSSVYTCLERETKVFFTFVPRSFLCVIIMKIVIFNSYNILSIKSKESIKYFV